MKWHPIVFEPIFKERIWGDRRIETVYGKPLPPGLPIGESWEIADRPEGESRVRNGPLAGNTLRWLMEKHQAELLGEAAPCNGRFPLLVKILDAQDVLSLQVHPPPEAAARLGGEPKTEMWYIADAEPGAHLLVGLKRGVTREVFERKLRDGTAAECVHRVAVRPRDAMFLPSGRVHAIGAGLLIYEIQQNSDTTYRVFDWNRVGADGKPRPLHIREALESIRFDDVEPSLVDAPERREGNVIRRELVKDALFEASEERAAAPVLRPLGDGRRPWIAACLKGEAQIGEAGGDGVSLKPGEFALIPAVLRTELRAPAGAAWLLAAPGLP